MIITWKYLPKQVGIPGHLKTGFMENPGFVFRDKALQRDFFTEKNPQLMVKPGGLGRLVVWIPRIPVMKGIGNLGARTPIRIPNH